MRALLHETMSGEPVTELRFAEASWSSGVCRSDEVSATLPGNLGRELYHYRVPRKFTVTIAEDDGRVRGAGVLSLPSAKTDRDGKHQLVFPGVGIESIFERRYVLPPNYWPIVDSGGFPIPARDTRYVGVEYGTMMKRLYAQAVSHPGGQLPVVWEPDRAGAHEKSWAASDGKGVQEAVEDISQLAEGVEWDWVPHLDENDRLTWSLITGTDAEPELASSYVHTWQAGGTDPGIRNLEDKISPEFMCQTAIFAGGKEADGIMLARATGSDLIDAGIPLSEIWDTSHSSVSRQETLNGWAQKRLSEGSTPTAYWSFDVRSDRAIALRHGDWCDIDVYKHWSIPDGSYRRRIVEVSGSTDPEWLSVVAAGALTW